MSDDPDAQVSCFTNIEYRHPNSSVNLLQRSVWKKLHHWWSLNFSYVSYWKLNIVDGVFEIFKIEYWNKNFDYEEFFFLICQSEEYHVFIYVK